MPELLHTPSELAKALVVQAPAVGFFRQLFADEEKNIHGTTEFYLDKVEGVTGVATYTTRNGEYTKVPEAGYLTEKFKPGYTKEEMTIVSEDLLDRDAGVPNLLGPQNPADGLTTKIGTQFAQLENRLQRTEEMQAAEAMTTGKVTIAGKGVDYVLDFGLKASHKVVPAILWGNTSTAVPINDLKKWKRVIADSGKSMGTNIAGVFSVDSFEAMMATDSFQKAFDNRRFESGQMKAKMINALGAQYEGFLIGFGEIWTYSREYKTAANATANYMTAKTVLVIDLDARFESHYGVISNMDSSSKGFKARRFPMSYKKDKGQGIENTLESSPLMAPINTDGIVVATVIA